MQAKVKTVINYMEELAPSSIALSGDPVGLQLGNPESEITKILVALDPDQNAVKEADSMGAEMLITHHPFFYNKLSSIDESYPGGALVASAIRKGLNIFSAHTNYDAAPRGVSYRLAKTLGLPAGEATVLEVTGSEQLLKLVVFVPAGYEDKIRDALAEAGAGHLGDYSHCTFQLPGTGTFMPGKGTDPFIGGHGQLEKVDEMRLETILSATRRSTVINALLEAHPYEEVAYDLYPLALEGRKIGLGLNLKLKDPISLEQLIYTCHSSLKPVSLRYWPSKKQQIRQVALCGGSGGSLIENASRQGAEVLISGDFRYHDLKNAQALDLALIDAGHDVTEWPGVTYLQQYLEERLAADKYETEVCLQTSVSTGWS